MLGATDLGAILGTRSVPVLPPTDSHCSKANWYETSYRLPPRVGPWFLFLPVVLLQRLHSERIPPVDRPKAEGQCVGSREGGKIRHVVV